MIKKHSISLKVCTGVRLELGKFDVPILNVGAIIFCIYMRNYVLRSRLDFKKHSSGVLAKCESMSVSTSS